MDMETTIKYKFLEGSNMTFQQVFDSASRVSFQYCKASPTSLGETISWKPLRRLPLNPH